MSKKRISFLCNNCGSVHAKWMGKCPDCGQWDALSEYREPVEDARRDAVVGTDSGPLVGAAVGAVALDDVDEGDGPRAPTGIGEFDRILGGGVVAGSVVLVGGEPGIGKSTLLLQVAHRLGHSEVRFRDVVGGSRAGVLYVTSEESARQTKLRAARLKLDPPRGSPRAGDAGAAGGLKVLAETNLDRIAEQVRKHKPAFVIVDSIQMIYKPSLPAAPGSVTQLRECCMDLVYLAKSSGTAIILVGHVTKAGALAGPKIIEHIVDTVVYFEGDRYHAHRIVRCVKNRFGSTHEVGLFEMGGDGLREVTEPGNLFVEQYGPAGQPSGSVITAAMTGSRVLLVEVQALTASSVIGAAKRKVSGASSDRVAMIIAVLEKRAGLKLAADDVFVNVAGGTKVAEPAIDLPIALAIASAHLNRPLPTGTLALGELGLGGEVRPVPQAEQRLREASRLGVSHAITPLMGGNTPKLKGMALHEVRMLSQAMAF